MDVSEIKESRDKGQNKLPPHTHTPRYGIFGITAAPVRGELNMVFMSSKRWGSQCFFLWRSRLPTSKPSRSGSRTFEK